jgi:beta-glucosidase
MKKFFINLMVILFLFQIFIAQAQTKNDKVIDKKVKALVRKMTLEEKIAELTQDAPANKRLGIPMMVYSECLHGLWLEGATVYPQAIALGSTWEPELLRKMTKEIAKEARRVNISHCYSPNLDVANGDPRYGRIEESYGEDPFLVSRMGVAFIEGLQGTGDNYLGKNNVLATAKHFVAYSENRTGINGAFSDVSLRRLYEIHFPAFEAAVREAKVGCVMPAHQDLNGVPCHADSWLLNDVLRKQWGFKGFIVSDNNDVLRLQTMHFITKNRTESAILGLKSGVDMDLVIGKGLENSAYLYSVLKDTLAKNPKLMKYVDQSVSRILRAKYQLGLFDELDKTFPTKIVSTPESQQVALEIAQKSIILLKNENNLLPLDRSKIKSIAVIGPNAHEFIEKKQSVVRNTTATPVAGNTNDLEGDVHPDMIGVKKYSLLGSYSGIPPYYNSVLDGIKKKAGNDIVVNYARGCQLTSFSKDGFDAAIEAAKKSDVVVLAVGGSTATCGEGIDRDDLNLYGVQNELVEAIHKTGKPIVVVLIHGRPNTINYIAENIPAIVETWYGGMRAGDAIADVLFGDVNPGGKLTVSVPRSTGQVPVTYLQKPDFVGAGKGLYRFADKTPLYHFGFGLSYTTFKYGEPKLAQNNIKVGQSTIVSVDVTNTGTRDGDEVVQMYIRDNYASVGRYNKLLKGFERVHLKAGETKTVSFEINPENLSLYDINLKKVVEPGDFTISVGASSMAKDLKTVMLNVVK